MYTDTLTIHDLLDHIADTTVTAVAGAASVRVILTRAGFFAGLWGHRTYIYINRGGLVVFIVTNILKCESNILVSAKDELNMLAVVETCIVKAGTRHRGTVDTVSGN